MALKYGWGVIQFHAQKYELQELHTWQNDSKIERFSRRESRVISFLAQGGINPESSILKAIT